MAITSCAETNVAQEAANVGKSLAAMGKLIGILNLFLGMIGAPEVPDLSDLAGTPLDEAIPSIDVIIESLQTVRDALKRWVPEAELVEIAVIREDATLQLRVRFRPAWRRGRSTEAPAEVSVPIEV